MVMSHHNDFRSQLPGLFDDDFGWISRAEMLLHRKVPGGELCSCCSQDGLCERRLRMCARIGQAIGRDTVLATGRQRVGWVDNA